MMESMFPLKLPPGISANGTKYQNAGRWNDGNLIRFHEGTIQPIGGWVRNSMSGAAIAGTPIAAISWQLADGTPWLAVGTTTNLYVIDANNIAYDITPAPANIPASPYNWQLTTFGAYLVAVNSLLGNQDLTLVNTYVWSGTTGTPAAPAWTTDVGPRGAYSAFTTPERFLVMLRGQDPTTHTARTGVDTAYSERRLYWATQETLAGFVSTTTNTGGDFDLTTDGRLVVGAASRGQSLLWTDTDLWTMNYIGGDLIYSFANVGRNCGIVSKRAHVLLDKGAYWMGRGKFYIYDGFVRSVPCEVTDAVFGNFNDARANTVWSFVNPRFNEITWFYPALGSQYPDHYVTFNYVEEHWTYGALNRSAGVPVRFTRDVIDQPFPAMFDSTGNFYNHETGQARNSQAYLMSGPIEIGDGERLMRIQGIAPDDASVGDVQLRLFTAMAPDDLEAMSGPTSLTAQTPLRVTGRQVRVRLEEVNSVSWRVGHLRLAVRPAERRGIGAGAITDNVPASIEIIPHAITLTTQQFYTFQSIVRNAEGQVLNIKPDVWTSSNTAGVTVDPTGTVSVLEAPCTSNIQAQINSPLLLSNIAVVTVAPRVPASITIESAVTVEQTGTVQLHATVRDTFGVILTDVVVNTWASDNVAEATVSTAGLVTGVAASGTCNVHASIASPALTSNACVVTCAKHYVIHTFALAGTNSLVVTSGAGNAEILIVGGGGSGGSVDGSGVGAGGGGAGELVHVLSQAIAAGTYALTIGGGGPFSRADHTIGAGAVIGNNGSDSTGFGYTARGGGGGGGADATLLRQGRAGGSGGGGASAADGAGGSYGGGATTAASPGVGFAGGSGQNSSGSTGAGGGGAGGAGSASGTGGIGLFLDIANVPGGTTQNYAAGGAAVTGAGASVGSGTGYGGQGGGQALNAQGTDGASGVIIVRYLLVTGINATGGTKVILP